MGIESDFIKYAIKYIGTLYDYWWFYVLDEEDREDIAEEMMRQEYELDDDLLLE